MMDGLYLTTYQEAMVVASEETFDYYVPVCFVNILCSNFLDF